MVQTFIIRGWLDNHEWGDEPPDPDDVWTEGDRVRLKNSTAEGTVQAQSSQPFLGSYLPYVQILWDGKKLPVPIDPSLLVRLSRTLPDEITWQAPQGFSDFKELLAVPFTQEKIMAKTITPSMEHDDIDEEEFYLAQTAGVELESVNSEQLTVDSEQDKPSIVNCQLSTDNCKFKPGDMVYVKKGNKRIKRTVGDRIGTGKNSAKILTLGGRSGKEEYWELPAKLELCQLTIETALLQDDELLSILDEQAFTSTVTITLRLKNRYEEQQISAVLAQLEEQGKVEKTVCGDGKTFAWRKSAQKQQDQDLLNKVFGAVLSEDGVGDWDIVKLLEYEFALIEVQRALKHLESEGKVIKSSLGGGVVWRKNSPLRVRQLPTEGNPPAALDSQSSTFAQVLDSGMQQPAQSSENTLNSSDSAKLTTTAETSSLSDTPTFQLSETSEIEKRLQELEQESCLDRCHANPSQSPENDKGLRMNEISSPTSSTSLTTSDQITSSLKTFPESSSAPTNLEEPPADFLDGFSGNFTSGGIMSSGKLSEAPTLALPSLEKDLFWLRSPQALSSTSETSRPPGQSKLEVQLKELGLIGKDQVINPEFLAKGLYNLPANWASLSVSAPATEILEINVRRMGIALTQELPQQSLITSPELNSNDLQERPSDESITSYHVPSAFPSYRSSFELPVIKEQKTDAAASTHDSSLVTDNCSLATGHQPVPFTQQKITDYFIQNDPSSFEWQGAGHYWIYPESIETDLGTQSRVETDGDTVRHYAAQMKDDLWEWEASIVGLLWDGDQLLPYDGHHRLKAAAAAGKMLLARIEEGNLQKAIALSCGSNKKPSLRRTREDNQKTIQMLEDLRVTNGDEWLLNIINAQLPPDKHFKEVSLRAIEFYTGIPFRTIGNIRKRKNESTPEKLPKVSFVPSEEEMKLIENIMENEGFETPASVFKWLLEEYKNQSAVNISQQSTVNGD
jgi:hypothetical protein